MEGIEVLPDLTVRLCDRQVKISPAEAFRLGELLLRGGVRRAIAEAAAEESSPVELLVTR